MWMLGAEGMVDGKRDRRTFLKSKEQLQQLFAQPQRCSMWLTPVTLFIRWIKHMGFTFVAEHANGDQKTAVLQFVRI